MYFKNLSLKKYELKNRDNTKGTLNGKKKNTKGGKGGGESYSSIPGIDTKRRLSLLFSPLLQEIFLQVHQFSPLLNNHHSKFKCQVFIRHCRILPILRRILCKRFGSLWLLFFYSNVEPLSKYSLVMLHLYPATKILNENPEMWFGKHNHFQLMSSSEFLFHAWTNHNYLK